MSDDALIRLQNLQKAGVDVKRLVDAGVGRYSYCRDLMTGNKSFGEKVARKIEEKLGWPRGCLDAVDGCATFVAKQGEWSSEVAPFGVNIGMPSKTIPTYMPYSPSNLSNSILLLGSLLGALDLRSRKLIGHLLSDLADSPDDAQDVAAKAAALASAQRPIVQDALLNKTLLSADAPDFIQGSFQTDTGKR